MSSDKPQSRSESQVDALAAEWIVRRDEGLSAREERALEIWIEADQRHRDRFQWYEKNWQRFSPLEEFETEEDHRREPGHGVSVAAFKESPVSGRHRARALAIGAAAAIVLVSMAGWIVAWRLNAEESVEYESRVVASTYQNRVLPDGTIIELNSGTRIKIRFTEKSRSIWLHDGEAYFHVAKDRKRPFEVVAGPTRVQAVGTEFNVRMDVEDVQIVVTEGRVRLSHLLPPELGSAEAKPYSLEMDAGEISTIGVAKRNDPPKVEAKTYDEIMGFLRWKPEILEFSSAPLGDVVMAFNKRNEIQITLEDQELETMPIAASFHSDNVVAFARMLELTFDLEAERRGQNNIVLSQPDRP